ncbi:MAG: 16S rRNA (guanine(527)-N(7))-methyltransferase RsmG [Acidobacteriaceae bacterium]
MAITPEQVAEASLRWGLAEIAAPVTDRLAAYGNLLLQWNTRISLTAIRDEAELIERHLMEGVFAAAHHPEAATALDFGSGNGVPGIPVALCRASIHVTLAESQRKKAAFLQEAVRKLNLRASVHAGRAETLPPASFDAVWMRAVDKSTANLPEAANLVDSRGALCLFGTSRPPDAPAFRNWQWKSLPFPGVNVRVLHIGRRM